MRFFIAIIIFSAFLFLAHPVLAQTSIPAFPGAEGFGAATKGGRGGRVMEVTNFNAAGTGSFRAALEASGPRIVVFTVGGTINLNGEIQIINPYITIAGQTAPGDGILIRGGTITVATQEVIIRGLRIRVGDDPIANVPADQRDGLGAENVDSGQDVYNVIFDHNSISWAIDENISIWSAPNLWGGKSFHHITVQWNITSEALYNSIHPKGGHSMGLIVGDRSKRISVHHNLLAHNNQRNPLLKGDTQTEVINNFIYDWGGSSTSISDSEARGPSFANIIGNYYKIGPSTRNNIHGLYFSTVSAGTKVFVQGNIGPTRANNTQPEWDIASGFPEYQSASPPFQLSGVTTQTAPQARDLILAKAGAFFPKRDAVDVRIIAEATNGTGKIIDHPNDVGGWPTLSSGTAPQDTDHDGMPDSWERSNGLNPNQNDSALDRNSDGYTNVEEYINSLILSSPISPTLSPPSSISPTLSPSACTFKKEGDADCIENPAHSGRSITLVDFEIWRKEKFDGCSQNTTNACGIDEDSDGSLMDENFNYTGSGNLPVEVTSVVDIVDFNIWRNGYFTL